MELIRKIIRALDNLRQKKQTGHECLSPSQTGVITAFPTHQWNRFTEYIDQFEQKQGSDEREALKRIIAAWQISPESLLELFQELGKSSDWQPVLDFADLPVEYDDVALDAAMTDYAALEAKNAPYDLLPAIFTQLNPTNLELLAMLLDGDSERYPDSSPPHIRKLIDRESAARRQITTLLEQPWTDMVRWWVVKSAKSLSDSAHAFIRTAVQKRHDKRMACMAMVLMLRYGLEWGAKHPKSIDRSVADFFYSKAYLNQIEGLVGLIHKPS